MHGLADAKFLFRVSLFLVLSPVFSLPCTTLFLPQSPDQVLAGNMDWPSGAGLMFINKRDVRKTSAFINAPLTPLQWTSHYMSLTLTQTGREFPWEGMNEAGLAVSMLLFTNTQLPQGQSLPGVNGMQFVQYLLDTAGTTAEAVAEAESVQIAGNFAGDEHYFVCDATGACAAIENSNFALVIHQGSSLPYIALANDSYHHELSNLEILLSSDTPSQILALPNTSSLNRFAKAAILSSQYQPQVQDVSYAYSALQTVAESDTQWHMVFKLAEQNFHWETVSTPTDKIVRLSEFNNQCSSGVQTFPVNSTMSGDVSPSFSPYTPAANNALVASNMQINDMAASDVAIIEAYPSTTQCTEENAALSSNISPSGVSQAVVLTAQVAGSGGPAPTGTVTFENGTTILGTGTLNASGTAQLSTSALPLGTNWLTAAYSGDASNPPITSPPWGQTVYTYWTTMGLTSSQNPTTLDQAVTFTATLSFPGSGWPTGTVTFSRNGNPLANVQVFNGQASYSLAFLDPGTKDITATYSGDTNYAPSSAYVMETVN